MASQIFAVNVEVGAVDANTPELRSGSADPEGSVTAPPGSIYLRTNGTIYGKASGTGNTGWSALAAGSGAPSTADYLVGTADSGLSAEIVVGTSPGGELGGTWASPTVDATHSGSAHHAAAHDHDEDDLVPDTVVAEENLGLSATGQTQSTVFRNFVADGALAVGDVVQASNGTAGRVEKCWTAGQPVIGVSLDAVSDGGTARIALAGVVQVLVDTAYATTFGVSSLLPLSTNAGHAYVSDASTDGLRFGSPKAVFAEAIETSASGTNRLVWAVLTPGFSLNLWPPSSGYPVDVDATEADGTGSQAARSDHRHALGIGITKGDLLVRTASNWVRLPVGVDGEVLTAASGATEGVDWASAGGGGPHTHDEDDLVPDTVVVDENVGLAATGQTQSVVYKNYGADGALAVGDIVQASNGTAGRVEKSYSLDLPVIGVSLDAVSDGATARIAVTGVCQVMVDTGSATTFGATVLWVNTSAPGQAAALTATDGLRFGSGVSLVGTAVETSAGGSDRLVWVNLGASLVPYIDPPATGYPVDIASTEADGTFAQPARADHRHAHEPAHINHDTTWAAKGDLIAATGNDAAAVVTVGANDTILMADSAAGSGIKWVASQTPSTQAFGDSAVEGTADTYTRGDHKHAMPAAAHHSGVAFSVGTTILNPASSTTVMVWRAPFACTVTNVRAHFKGGTSVIYNARLNQTSNHLSSNATQSTANAWGDGGSVQNTAYAAGDDLELMFVTITGAVTEATIQVDFTRTI
jgi:uncharacterized protein YkvS